MGILAEEAKNAGFPIHTEFPSQFGADFCSMKTDCLNIDGHYYPVSDRRWGGCAEELLRYTSRYYVYAQALLRSLASRFEFEMAGYQASRLNLEQRALLAQMLALPPVPELAVDVIVLVESVIVGEVSLSRELVARYPVTPVQPKKPVLVYADRPHEHLVTDTTPLDPFISLATRLHIPYSVEGHHVDVPFRVLARHLDSSLAQVRENLRDAILFLHEGGYLLRNDGETSEADSDRPPP